MSSLTEFFIDRSMRLIARCLAAGKLRTVASGLENLPSTGPALIVARHYHHLYDGLTFFAALERRCHFVVALDWVKSQRGKFFMRMLNRVARWPMLLRADALRPDNNSSAILFSGNEPARYRRDALRAATELLIEGRLLVVFPEGYPNIDPVSSRKREPEQFLPFKPGFLSILRAAEARLNIKIPIIPAGLRYEPGNPWHGYLSFGGPIYRDQGVRRQAFLKSLESEVKKLSGYLAEN